jgi:uncharacterized protein YdaU (DUF1376 family)
VNYYEHHIGDYDQATAHLTACEDGIYSRLIRWYMASEEPLPSDLAAIQRRVRAHTRDEKAAVKTILAEFFELTPDGYRQQRCDEEVARFQDKQRKAKASANARWSQSDRNANAHANASPNAHASHMRTDMRTDMRTQSEGNAPRARPQTPDTRHQTPDKENTRTATATDVARVVETLDGAEPGVTEPQPGPTPAGRLCRLMCQVGIADTNPGHPDLLVLVEAGATDEEFQGAARTAVERGKGFAYAIGMLRRQRQEAAAAAKTLHRGAMPNRQEALEASNRAIAERWANTTGDTTP